MKALIFVALLVTTIASCKKDKATGTNSNGAIAGKWDLVLVTGGIASIHQTAAQWGHTKNITFNTDSTCIISFDGLTTPGRYFEEYSADYRKNLSILYLDSTSMFIINYAHDTLILDGYAIVDGTSEWYVRK